MASFSKPHHSTTDVIHPLEKVVIRRFFGTPVVNVPWRHRHHSPTGFEFGYHGSGPADLALNILSIYLPIKGATVTEDDLNKLYGNPVPGEPGLYEVPEERYEEYLNRLEWLPVRLWDGSYVSKEAFVLHQDFKREFIAKLPESGGEIPGAEIRAWVERKLRELKPSF